jgi:hypothetical protein
MNFDPKKMKVIDFLSLDLYLLNQKFHVIEQKKVVEVVWMDHEYLHHLCDRLDCADDDPRESSNGTTNQARHVDYSRARLLESRCQSLVHLDRENCQSSLDQIEL